MIGSLLFFRFKRNWWFWCIFPLFFLTIRAEAQTNAACQQILRDARESYEVGHLIKVTTMMNKCMNNFSRANKVEALKLITQAYIFQDNLRKAEETMVELLSYAPDFQPDPESDPAELINLFNKYRTRPVYSIGFETGINITGVNFVEVRQVSGNSRDRQTVSSSVDFQLGAVLDVLIYEHWSASLGVNFKLLNFTVSDQPYNIRRDSLPGSNNPSTNTPETNYDFTRATVVENQSWIEIPISVKYTFNENKIRPYVLLGIQPAFLMNATGEFDLNHKDPPPEDDPFNLPTQADQILTDVDLKDQRSNFNLSLIAGAGVRIKNGINHIIVEARVHNGITNLSERRYANQDLIFNQSYTDSGFGINNFSFSAGYVWNFYKIKKLR